MKAVDLGYTPKYMLDSPVSTKGGKKKKEKPPTVFPSLVICDKPDITESAKLGEEITATVRLKATQITQRDPKSKDSYQDDHRVEFDVLSIQLPDKKTDDLGTKEKGPDFSMLDKEPEEDDEE